MRSVGSQHAPNDDGAGAEKRAWNPEHGAALSPILPGRRAKARRLSHLA
jgi:hypothetical protein